MDNKLVLFLEEIGFVETHSYPSSLLLVKNIQPIYYGKITIYIEEISGNCINFKCYVQRENPTEEDEKMVARLRIMTYNHTNLFSKISKMIEFAELFELYVLLMCEENTYLSFSDNPKDHRYTSRYGDELSLEGDYPEFFCHI